MRAPNARDRKAGGIVLVYDGNRPQLVLPIDDMGNDIFDVVRRTCTAEGLRHFAAFLLQLTDSGRQRRMVWRLERHMEALQCGADARRRSDVRERIAREALAVAALILEARAPNGRDYIRQAFFTPIAEAGHKVGNRRTLEGMTLEVHPLIFNGVRREDGELGNNWFPASPDLPSLHHVKHAPALLAGLRLPQRWRYAYGENGRTYVDLRGDNALDVFGIEGVGSRERNKGRAWETFDANVAALAALPTPGIGAVEWVSGRHAAEGVVRIHAPRRAIDIIAHRIAPIETKPPPPLRSGNDLRAWREGRGLTQGALAAMLGVSARTVRGAELSADAPLPPKVRDAIEEGRITQAPRALPAPR